MVEKQRRNIARVTKRGRDFCVQERPPDPDPRLASECQRPACLRGKRALKLCSNVQGRFTGAQCSELKEFSYNR